jgi:hypothetical protein
MSLIITNEDGGDSDEDHDSEAEEELVDDLEDRANN